MRRARLPVQQQVLESEIADILNGMPPVDGNDGTPGRIDPV